MVCGSTIRIWELMIRLPPAAFIGGMVQIEDDMRITTLGIGIAMNTHAVGCCQFGLDAVVLKHDLVITRTCRFLIVGESRLITRARFRRVLCFGGWSTGHRHQ